jgi:hypothetical protein
VVQEGDVSPGAFDFNRSLDVVTETGPWVLLTKSEIQLRSKEIT